MMPTRLRNSNIHEIMSVGSIWRGRLCKAGVLNARANVLAQQRWHDWWGWKQYSMNCLHQNIQGDHAYESSLHRYASVTNIQGKVQIYFFLRGGGWAWFLFTFEEFQSHSFLCVCCCFWGVGRGLVFFPAWMPVVQHPNFTCLIAHIYTVDHFIDTNMTPKCCLNWKWS